MPPAPAGRSPAYEKAGSYRSSAGSIRRARDLVREEARAVDGRAAPGDLAVVSREHHFIRLAVDPRHTHRAPYVHTEPRRGLEQREGHPHGVGDRLSGYHEAVVLRLDL